MAKPVYALNDARACLAISGEDRVAFLQGLVSNDVAKASAARAVYAALLTGQGRFLHDLFIATSADGTSLLIEAEAPRLDDLKRRLGIYKLRAKVAIADARDTLATALVWGDGAPSVFDLPAEPGAARSWGGGIVFVDPRLAALGCRAILPRATAATILSDAGLAEAPLTGHRHLRLSLGVPEGSSDLPPEKALPLENGFDALNGVDFAKGCYVGQELTARMKHRALVKKRLVPVAIDGSAPALGTIVTQGAEEAGELRAAEDGIGLALLRIDAVENPSGAPLVAGTARLRPLKPGWLD